MANQITELNGISTSAVYQEADMYDLVNLDKRTGVLKPTFIKLDELTDYEDSIDGDILSSYKHNSTGSCNALLIITDKGTLYANTTQVATSIPTDATISAVGNVVSVATSSEIRYFLCQSGTYKEVVLNTDTIADLVELRVSLHKRGGSVEFLQFRGEQLSAGATQQDVENVAKALFARARAKVSELGYLQDFHLAITAVELFDGSIMMHSVPVLLGQANDVGQRYEGVSMYDSITTKSYFMNYRYAPMVVGISGTVLDDIGENQLNEDGYYSFNGTPTKLFGGVNGGKTNTGASTNKLTYAPFTMAYNTNTMETTPHLYAYQNELQYRFKKGLNKDDAKLLKSVNVYLSAPSSMFDANNLDKDIRSCIFDGGIGINTSNIRPLIRENKDIIADLFESDFYKVAEITISGAISDTSTWTALDLKNKVGANLFVQQTLPIDPGRHKISVNGGQYVYNNRLHIYNYTEKFWKGFNPNWLMQSTTDGQFNKNQSTGQFQTGVFGYVSVDLKTENSTSVLVHNLSGNSTNAYPIAAVVGYPDRRATKLEVVLFKSGYLYKRTFFLNPSKTHNFAYAIRSDLKTEKIPESQGTWDQISPTSTQEEINITNGIRVSETSNPFYFHPRNSYRIGSSGTVLRVGLNKMNISERNFGSFPLYAQNENSWYSLQQGTGEVAYSNVIPVSGDIATNENILETPYGLIYVGIKGLYVFNNNKSELLTSNLQEPPLKLNIEQYEDMSVELKSMLDNIHNDFVLYLQNLTSAIYDPLEDVVVLTNNTKTFSYVYSLQNKHLYRTDKVAAKLVENALTIVNNQPIITLFNEKKTYTIERDRDGDDTTEVLFVTRPIIFNTADIKRLDRAMLSAIMYAERETELTFMVYVSNDGVNFKLARARIFTVPEKISNEDDDIVGYKDIDTLHLAGTKYRYYMYALYGTLAEKSEISLITSAVHKEYTNDKIR